MDAPSYRQSRTLVLGTGSAVLVVTAIGLMLSATDTVVVLGVILFLPVFIAAVMGGVRAGMLAAVAASMAYVGLRWPAINLYGLEPLSRDIGKLVLGYLVFGGAGGWAAGIVGAGMTKLDRFDVTDDHSELLNARGVHRQLEQEAARATRYGSNFAVVTVTFAIQGDKREARKRIGDIVRQGVRTVDDTGRITMAGRDVVIAVLPETPRAGAEIVGAKVAERLAAEVGDIETEVAWLTHPEDDDAIAALLKSLAALVKREHPEAAV
jgi:hypothetical protein